MADSDPPDEIGDGEPPGDRDFRCPKCRRLCRTDRSRRRSSSIRQHEAEGKADYQKSGILRVSTIGRSVSVTVSKVWPGAINRRRLGSERRRALAVFVRSSALLTSKRDSDCAARQISGARPRIQFRQHCVIQLFRLNFETRLLGSLMSPKTIAWVGQACWQAV